MDTTIGVRNLPLGSSMRKDVNGDGLITDADVVIQLLSALGPGPDGDLDGDGLPTAADTILAVEKIIFASCGDVNGTETIDDQDLDAILTDLMTSGESPTSDANMDSEVTIEDVLYVIEKAGESTFFCESCSQWLAEYLTQAREDGGDWLWLDQSNTQDHHVVISDSWPREAPRHQQKYSQTSWPPNHSAYQSTQWPNRDSAPPHVASLSVLWPPDHMHEYSSGWRQPHSLPTSGGERTHNCPTSRYHHTGYSINLDPPSPDHNTDASWRAHDSRVSSDWERTHDQDLSQYWRAPNHQRPISATWTPPPGTWVHQQVDSRRWPTNHQGSLSRSLEYPVSPHDQMFSLGWSHGAEWSRKWPPNHHMYMSRNWQSHEARFSLSWPPNHINVISFTWPVRLPPGRLPPNHVIRVSDLDFMPSPRSPSDWPVWPPDHNWFHTIREIVTIPADVIPSFPGGGGGGQ